MGYRETSADSTFSHGDYSVSTTESQQGGWPPHLHGNKEAVKATGWGCSPCLPCLEGRQTLQEP